MRIRCIGLLILLSLSEQLAAYEIVPIDRIDGNRGLALSADGRVVVGSDATNPYRWTREGGAVNLGDLAGYQSTGVSDVSDDGTVIVGRGNNQPTKAYRWTQQGGMVGLGPVPGFSESRATAVSGDGSTVIGNSESSAAGFVWTAQRGMVRLSPAGGAYTVNARDVSADGRVIALTISPNFTIGRAVLWNAQDGFQELGPLPAGWETTISAQISADGKTVLGTGGPGGPDILGTFLWSQATGFMILPGLRGGGRMTPDAKVVMNNNLSDGLTTPVIWDEGHGDRLLHDVLANEHGFSATDLFFDFVHDISADQRTLLVRSGNQLSAVYLDKPLVTPVPEPSSSLLVIAGVLAIAAKRRRHAK